MSEKPTVAQALLEGMQKSDKSTLSQSWITRDGKIFDNRKDALAHMLKLEKKK